MHITLCYLLETYQICIVIYSYAYLMIIWHILKGLWYLFLFYSVEIHKIHYILVDIFSGCQCHFVENCTINLLTYNYVIYLFLQKTSHFFITIYKYIINTILLSSMIFYLVKVFMITILLLSIIWYQSDIYNFYL